MQDGTITGAGIDTGKITYKSDHRMVGVRVNFTTMVGRIEGMPKTQKTRPRTVKATIKKKQRGLQNYSTKQRRQTGRKKREEKRVQILGNRTQQNKKQNNQGINKTK